METLDLATVLKAERDARAIGTAHMEGLRAAAFQWIEASQSGCLNLGPGVREALERITAAPMG
ncbi:hypothetical protein KIH07_02805 [Hydrogenophaga taeniospiralis]|uniref:hypothetical protein n=1 Tax=Hydrogenophaga taeniospiralis TaxID=65656 RepID=UPI001CFA0364|nr:hypothetical protein [Hydrogenophaga taeniospiralis]MCB4362648.1 hypothetical protein [Hydrogenophaga taeniospiralis]